MSNATLDRDDDEDEDDEISEQEALEAERDAVDGWIDEIEQRHELIRDNLAKRGQSPDLGVLERLTKLSFQMELRDATLESIEVTEELTESIGKLFEAAAMVAQQAPRPASHSEQRRDARRAPLPSSGPPPLTLVVPPKKPWETP